MSGPKTQILKGNPLAVLCLLGYPTPWVQSDTALYRHASTPWEIPWGEADPVTCSRGTAARDELASLSLVPVYEAIQQGYGEAIAGAPGRGSLRRTHDRSQLPAQYA